MATQNSGASTAGRRPTPSPADVAKDQAGNVKESAAQASGQVLDTTKEQAKDVAGQAGAKARDLAGQVRSQVTTQGNEQKQKAVTALQALSDELDTMAQSGSGVATTVLRQVSGRTRGVAQWLEEKEPAELLGEVNQLARRRPGAFLLGASVAGVVAGRFVKGLAPAKPPRSSSGPSSQGQYAPPVRPLPAEPTPGVAPVDFGSSGDLGREGYAGTTGPAVTHGDPLTSLPGEGLSRTETVIRPSSGRVDPDSPSTSGTVIR